jgi:hypothetical protein
LLALTWRSGLARDPTIGKKAGRIAEPDPIGRVRAGKQLGHERNALLPRNDGDQVCAGLAAARVRCFPWQRLIVPCQTMPAFLGNRRTRSGLAAQAGGAAAMPVGPRPGVAFFDAGAHLAVSAGGPPAAR